MTKAISAPHLIGRVATMRVLKGRAIGANTVVVDETLPEAAAIDVIVHEGEPATWSLSEKGWALLDEASDDIRKGRFVTDEELQAEIDAINAE